MHDLCRNDLILEVLTEFARRNIDYIVIGTSAYEKPSDVGDIDIICPEDTLEEAYRATIQTLNALSIDIYITRSRPSPSFFPDKKILIDMSATGEHLLQIDLQSSYHYRGIVYFDYPLAARFLSDTSVIRSLNSEVVPLIGALKDRLYGNPVKPDRLEKGYTDHDFIKLFVGLGCNQRFVSVMASDVQTFSGRAHYVASFLRVFFAIRKVRGLARYSRSLFAAAFLRRNVMLMAFSGPDGSGKSSIIDQLTKSPLIAEAFDSVIVRHTRPHRIPALSRLKILRYREEDKLVTARSTQPISTIHGLISLVYYLFDYIVEGLFVALIPTRKKKLHIYDRYFYKYGYQHTFKNIPTLILRLANFFVLRPKVNIFVHADPEIIVARKHELTEEEVSQQILEFTAINEQLSLNVSFLDTSHQTISQAVKLVKERAAKVAH